MNLIRKIKKIFIEEKEEEIVDEVINFNDLYSRVDKIIFENTEKEIQIKKEMDHLIDTFVKGIKHTVFEIENVDLSKRKEHEKIKLVVNENLSLYHSNLKRLVENLSNLKNHNIRDQIPKILNSFNEFNRLSDMAYKKANILVGKELEEAKNNLNNFSINFNELVAVNQLFFEKSSSANQLKSLLSEIKQTDSYESELDIKISDYKESITKANEEIKKRKKEIENLKSSEDYILDTEKKENLKNKSIELENALQKAKNNINFKLLLKVYHADQKKSELIKNYSSNFKLALKQDENLDLWELIKESQNSDLINLKRLKDDLLFSENPPKLKVFEDIALIESKVTELKNEISSSEIKIDEENKKKEKLTSKKEKLILDSKSLSKKVFANLKIE